MAESSLLTQVVSYYHDTLKQAPDALAFLEAKGLIHGELIDRFRNGDTHSLSIIENRLLPDNRA